MAIVHKELKRVYSSDYYSWKWFVWYESELKPHERKKRNLKRKKIRELQRKQRITDLNFKKHGYRTHSNPERTPMGSISQRTRWKQPKKHEREIPSGNSHKKRRRHLYRTNQTNSA